MDVEDIKKLIGSSVNNYQITKYINSGSFGHVVEAKNLRDDQLVALKIPIKKEDKDGQKSVLAEARIYKQLSSPEHGIANMKVMKNKDKKIIVMDLLGPSLEALLIKHKRFGLKTIILLAIQMIDIIKYIHSCGYLHRDLKPDNFVVGYDDPTKLYCIDFGLAKRFMKKDEHIKFCKHAKFCGTARYASLAAHKYHEQGRKDDLEAIGYILVYLYKGKLPWMGIKHNKDKHERYRLIGVKKEETSEEELTKNMPKEFCVFLKYVRNMDFDEKPYYSALRKMFLKLYQSQNYKNDKLEWQ